MPERQNHPPQNTKRKKGGKFFPALCNVLGTLLLVSVIALLLPITAPQLLGYQVYNVESASMAPEIPVGSILYVQAVPGSQVQKHEIIAFGRGGVVVTHRVIENRVVEGEFITKGDANEQEDMEPVNYDELIGRVTLHVPYMGTLMTYLSTNLGKLYLGLVIACGVMFNLLASWLRKLRKSEQELAMKQKLLLQQAEEEPPGEE